MLEVQLYTTGDAIQVNNITLAVGVGLELEFQRTSESRFPHYWHGIRHLSSVYRRRLHRVFEARYEGNVKHRMIVDRKRRRRLNAFA